MSWSMEVTVSELSSKLRWVNAEGGMESSMMSVLLLLVVSEAGELEAEEGEQDEPDDEDDNGAELSVWLLELSFPCSRFRIACTIIKLMTDTQVNAHTMRR